eukprot:6648587-Pyramimonas_sp.AAC.1
MRIIRVTKLQTGMLFGPPWTNSLPLGDFRSCSSTPTRGSVPARMQRSGTRDFTRTRTLLG